MAHISITALNSTTFSSSSYRSSDTTATKFTSSEQQAVQKHVTEQSDSYIRANQASSLTRQKGEPYNLYEDQPELKELAKALAERLDGTVHEAIADHLFYQDSMRDLDRAGVLTDPEFLDMANSMSDEELADFALTIKAMMLPASVNYTSHNEADRSYNDKVAEFVNVLKDSNTTDRAAILNRSADYANQVDVDAAVSFEQNVFGQTLTNFKFDPYRSDTSANNLHNYISAVVMTEDPAALTQQLDNMSDEAQKGLLNIYGLDTELGERLSTLIGQEGSNVPVSLLSALGDMADSVKDPFLKSDVDKKHGYIWIGDEVLSKDNEESQGRDFALDSVSSMITTLERYDFSQEQKETMGSELSHLSNPEKRAYIEITTTGLDDMLQSKEHDSFNKKNLDEAIEVVSTLRSNQNVLSLVSSARYHDITLIERPDIEEGQKVIALEGASVFKDFNTAIRESRMFANILPEEANIVNGHSEKGHESENLYSSKSFDVYKKDVNNLVSTLVAFETMRGDSTAAKTASLDQFAETLTDMHSGIRDETLARVNEALDTNSLREKATENTQLAFFSSLIQQMAFETERDFRNQ